MEPRSFQSLTTASSTAKNQNPESIVTADCLRTDPPATILVVEDEDCVRTVTREVLESDGYFVLDAADGADGISACQEYPGTIDLVLSDVVMPGMNGGDMARRLLELKPDLRVIFMSGYTDNLLESFSDARTMYLQKPFTVDALRARIQQMLKGKGGIAAD